jgi:hypothetical protein
MAKPVPSKQSKRFLVQKPKGGKAPRELTHEQVTQAVRSFQTKGGLIKKLPPQEVDARTMVGKQWDVAYESVIDRW